MTELVRLATRRMKVSIPFPMIFMNNGIEEQLMQASLLYARFEMMHVNFLTMLNMHVYIGHF